MQNIVDKPLLLFKSFSLRRVEDVCMIYKLAFIFENDNMFGLDETEHV